MQNGPLQGLGKNTLPDSKQEYTIEQSPLHKATLIGDEKLVELLLAAGADRTVRDLKYGNTPLHEAAWRGYSRCLKLLCALPKIKTDKTSKESNKQNTQKSLHSTLLALRNNGGFTALHLAAQNGHNQSCREILLAGSDPNVQNNYGDTPLHTACRYGHAGATRILLSGKCDPERVNLNGDTSLHIACAMGRRKLTRILLEAECSVHIKNAQNETARDIALRKKLIEIIEILDNYILKTLQKLPINEKLRSKNSNDQPHKQSPIQSTGGKNNKSIKINANGKEIKNDDTNNNNNISNHRNWSPYGCHYFPDPRAFPSPKLETLPKEPLESGEQYYLDLAGNIRKGPVGVGNTCYCGPFFRHIEDSIIKNKKSIKKYVHKATEKIDCKVQALAMKTDDNIEQITKSMIADRIRCEGQRLHLEQWIKRGGLTRATVAPHKLKSQKNQTNTNTLTRCKSLELLDEKHNIVEQLQDNYNPSAYVIGPAKSFDLLIDNNDNETTSPKMNIKLNNPIESDDVVEKLKSSQEQQKQHKKIHNRHRLPSTSQSQSISSSVTPIDCPDGSTDGNKINHHTKEMLKYNEKDLCVKLDRSEKLPETVEMKNSNRNENSKLRSIITKKHKKLKENHQFTKKQPPPQTRHQQLSLTNSPTISSNTTDKKINFNEISNEMNKIANSFNCDKNRSPKSPEISKEFTSEKQSDNNHAGDDDDYIDIEDDDDDDDDDDQHQHDLSSIDEKLKQLEHSMKTLTTFQLYRQPSNIDQNKSNYSGFYQNHTFTDQRQSSTADISIDKQPENLCKSSNKIGDFNEDQTTVIKNRNLELDQLKSRILNGSHWRSQVLKTSAINVNNNPNISNNSTSSSMLNRTASDLPIQSDQFNDSSNISIKYEIKNSEIKNLKNNNNNITNNNSINNDNNNININKSDTDISIARPPSLYEQDGSPIRHIKSPTKIKLSDNEIQIHNYPLINYLDLKNLPKSDKSTEQENQQHQQQRIQYKSESSEDEDDDEDVDEIYGKNIYNIQNLEKRSLPVINEINLTQYNRQNDKNKIYSNNQQIYNLKHYQHQLELEQHEPQQYLHPHQLPATTISGSISNTPNVISQSYKSFVPRIIDTSNLIPKDAYFHELPNKNRLNHSTGARNRNPLPPILTDTETLCQNTDNLHYRDPLNQDHVQNQQQPQHHIEQPLHNLVPCYSNIIQKPLIFLNSNNNYVNSTKQLSAPFIEQNKLLANRKFVLSPGDGQNIMTNNNNNRTLSRTQLHNDSGYNSTKIGENGEEPNSCLPVTLNTHHYHHHQHIESSSQQSDTNINKYDSNYIDTTNIGASSLV